MDNNTSTYQSPLAGRYASKEMKQLFSADKRFTTWRRLWVALAEAEQTLGLEITDQQLEELRAHVADINYEVANAREREVRHDVMAHVYAYGQQCPQAAGIIHLGATSCYVTDNADVMILREGLALVKRKLLGVIENLAKFAEEYKALPTLGMTHYQPATPVTVGKRATLWLQSFMENVAELEFVEGRLKLLGCRGATGTSETFMELFDGDEEKVKLLDKLIATAMGFAEEAIWSVSGQTYPRTLDNVVLNCLANIATSAHKMATDIRLLQHDKELEEPFAENQIGSSAMAYKRNPMRSERICSLARFVENLAHNAYDTANTQWLERTLDDSANRRLTLSEAFLGTDAVLIISANVTDGLVVYPKMIEKHLREELPFVVTEKLLMRAVENGGNRQEVHELIRQHAMTAAQEVKEQGLANNLIHDISTDPKLRTLLSADEILATLDWQKLIGRCPDQVEDYLQGEVRPLLARYAELMKAQFDTQLTV